MTFEERLDKLTVRHEALTQSVELLLHAQQDNERAMEKTQAAMDKNQAAMAKTQTMLADVVMSIDSLARIAHVHERRITGLEGGRE